MREIYEKDNHIKECIANALIELMKKYPFDDITINEICYTAHIARATYYHYAKGKHGKEDLLSFKLITGFKKFDELARTKTDYDILIYIYDNKELFSMLEKNKLSNVVISFLKYAVQDDTIKTINPYLSSYVTFSYLGVIYQWVKDDFSKLPVEVATIIFKAYQKILSDYLTNNE